jgi:hypothetical protein
MPPDDAGRLGGNIVNGTYQKIMSRICKNASIAIVSKIVDGSGFVISTGTERPRTHTWLSGYQSPGAHPANPVIGVSPAKLESVKPSESEIVRKIFLMFYLLYFCLIMTPRL